MRRVPVPSSCAAFQNFNAERRTCKHFVRPPVFVIWDKIPHTLATWRQLVGLCRRNSPRAAMQPGTASWRPFWEQTTTDENAGLNSRTRITTTKRGGYIPVVHFITSKGVTRFNKDSTGHLTRFRQPGRCAMDLICLVPSRCFQTSGQRWILKMIPLQFIRLFFWHGRNLHARLLSFRAEIRHEKHSRRFEVTSSKERLQNATREFWRMAFLDSLSSPSGLSIKNIANLSR